MINIQNKLPLNVQIGLRYIKAKRRNGFISFISLISFIGIALGVASLITVLSVMNGFESNLKSKILGMTSHITIVAPNGKLQNWRQPFDIALKNPKITGAAPYIEDQAMATNKFTSSGVLLRGINPDFEKTVSDIDQKMISGSIDTLNNQRFNIIVGSGFAFNYGVIVGDKINLIIPKADASIIGIIPRSKRFTVSGIFQVGMYEYDNSLVIVNIKDAALLYKMKNTVSGVRLKSTNLFETSNITKELISKIDKSLIIEDWTVQHSNFFQAIKMEKLVMFIILSLVVIVAAFNIVSTMIMVVTDKESEIAILRTLGILPSGITKIFFTQGVVIGFVGTVIGVVFGVLLALNVENIVPIIEQLLGTKFLAADVYYISEIPSELQLNDVLKISTLSFIISVVATWYPAVKASKVKPAEALRYE